MKKTKDYPKKYYKVLKAMDKAVKSDEFEKAINNKNMEKKIIQVEISTSAESGYWEDITKNYFSGVAQGGRVDLGKDEKAYSPKVCALKIIDSFNASLRPGEAERKLIAVRVTYRELIIL